MKLSLRFLFLLLVSLMLPTAASAEYEQLAEGIYQDGTALYISSDVVSIGDLHINPSVIYCYALIPPACTGNTFASYDAELHVPASAMANYFTTLYWYNFSNIISDAVEPITVTLNKESAVLEMNRQLHLIATVNPDNATPDDVVWLSTNSEIATVSNGTVIPISRGECDIIAYCGNKQAVCHVKVVSEHVTIMLDKHYVRVLPNHLVTLIASCSPVTTELSVTSSNDAIAMPRIVNGTIQILGRSEGTATITVNAADGNGDPDECEVVVYIENGDVNSDGYVNISDVTSLIDYLLSGNPSGINLKGADCNIDGNINISDVTTLIDYLLSGKWQWERDMTFTVNDVTFKMIHVKGGTYTMGATEEQGNDATDNEKPTHEVSLSGYFIGETEVTQALWFAVMGQSPSYFRNRLNNPVEQISWNDCQEFIYRLNQMTGKKFRLPTEAEWEFAARGGTMSKGYKYAGGDTIDNVAWYNNNSSSNTKPVATKAPNELGLYDMSGNVWEWCQDWSNGYGHEDQTNPVGYSSENTHFLRGGGWNNEATDCRVSYRAVNEQTFIWFAHGLRLALDVDNTDKLCLSESVVKIEIDEQILVNILNGSGNYTLDGETNIVSAEINGNILTIKGKELGTSSIRITDNTTGQQTSLAYIVDVPLEEFTINGVTFKMILVESGTYMMGATQEQSGQATWEEAPAHEVTLSSFYIGQTEITQEQWKAVMGSNPGWFSGSLTLPIERVNKLECQTFVNKLSQITGKTFRLPTEAEWEFAARGGNKSKHYIFSGSNYIEEVGWYYYNADSKTHPVARKKPNELGLYDMSGNVGEWVQETEYYYNSTPQTDPLGPTTGTNHIDRGGGLREARTCRTSSRHFTKYAGTDIGLRIVLEL